METTFSRITSNVVGTLGRAAAMLLLATPCIAQAVKPECREEKPLTGDIGIVGFRCVAAGCAVNGLRDGCYRHWFSAEPYLLGIDPQGPLAGLAEAGDRIVAIDGALITTPSGGERLANLTPGKEIRLHVRRGETLNVIKVTPRLGCNMPSLIVTSHNRKIDPKDWNFDD